MHSVGYALRREGFSEPGLILTGIHHLLILTFYCKKPALHDVSFYKIYIRGLKFTFSESYFFFFVFQAESERNGGKPSLDLKGKGNNNIIMMENATRSCYCGTKKV